jgi:predicted Zn-dependent protease
LSDAELESAFRAALKLDAPELAERFARAVVARPATQGADRYPVFQHLIVAAQTASDYDDALKLIDAGLLADQSANDGQRESDYETRRGQVLAKRGDAETAIETFEKILSREPGNLKVVGSASEALLGAKKATAALQFAERGLAQAREQNNRDMEGYFLELSDAARRQGA